MEHLSDADLRSLSARQFARSEFDLAPTDETVTGENGAQIKQKRINGLAYSGEPVDRSFGKMIIDLSTLRMDGSGRVPMLFRHGTGDLCESMVDARLGMWDQVKIDAKSGVTASGYFLSGKPLVEEVLSDAKGGYRWQLSVGVTDGRLERIPMGETREINGRVCGGGMYVYSGGMLREISLCEIGADPTTDTEFELRAQPAAQLRESFYQRGKGRVARLLSTMGVSARAIMELAREEQGADLDTAGVAALAAAPSSPGVSPMATENKPAPATIQQLRALKGASDSFILKSMEQSLTIDAAAAALCGELHQELTTLAAEHAKQIEQLNAAHAEALKAATDKAAELQARIDGALKAGAGEALKLAPAGAVKDPSAKAGPVEFTGATGTDPEKDWNACEAIRLQWDDNRTAFTRFANQQKRRGKSYLVQVKS